MARATDQRQGEEEEQELRCVDRLATRPKVAARTESQLRNDGFLSGDIWAVPASLTQRAPVMSVLLPVVTAAAAQDPQITCEMKPLMQLVGHTLGNGVPQLQWPTRR